MTDRSVTAGWAVWSKEPDTRDDYSVLAFSDGPMSKGEFARLLAHFAPGSPSAEAGTPASLPWVTLSRVGVAKELYLGISVQTATSDKDGAGRPISRTTYFCVPYAPLARNPVSYQDLYAAVADPGLLADAGRNVVPLAVPPLDPAALAQAVSDEFGAPELVTRTAAMLLGGPVTVTGPKFPGLTDRLRFFDAVTALLPYGYRAHLTAATWSDTGAGDRFRLVFADRARDDASRVRWGTPPPPPEAGPAVGYLGYLDRALRGAGEGRLESLIAYLARDSEPCKFEEPGRAVERIHDFFRPAVIAERLDAGAARLSDVRRLFTDDRVRELPAARRTQLLSRLIRGADQEDMGLVILWYDQVAGDDPGALLTDVAVACRSRLWPSGSTGVAREYLGLMTLRGLADELLARLVALPEGGIDPVAGLEALGQLLADLVIASAPGPGSFPRTQRAVAGNLAAGAALLACLAASWRPGSRRLELAAEWLEPVADQVVAPFMALFGDAFGSGPKVVTETAGTAVIAKLDRYGDHASVRFLLRAASYRKRLHLVLPAFACWLVAGRDEATEQDIRYWGEVVPELTPATAEEAAWLDLVLLLTGNDPRALLSGRYAQPLFSQRLAQAWRELAAMAGPPVGAADELAETALTAFLERASWRADRTQAAAVGHLVRALTEKVPRPRLLAVALDPGETLRQMPPGAPPEEIARACARAHAKGLKIRQVIEALTQSGAITSAAQAAEVIEHLHRELAAADVGNESFTWPLDLAARLAQGAISRPHTADFPALAARRYSQEMLFRIRLLDAVARCAPPDAPPAIDAYLLEYLEVNRHDLDELLKEARKRQPRGSLKGLMRGGRPGEAKPPEPGEPAPGTGSGAGTPGQHGGPA
ncbi:MAG: hypothetical protein ACRDP5_08695 [Streptosporangiaceae bacterium]